MSDEYRYDPEYRLHVLETKMKVEEKRHRAEESGADMEYVNKILSAYERASYANAEISARNRREINERYYGNSVNGFMARIGRAVRHIFCGKENWES
jgi:hypothetical protein